MNTLDWLLDLDPPRPALLLALRDLVRRPAADRKLLAARAAAHAAPPIAAILDAMHSTATVKPGSGYGPKYRSAAPDRPSPGSAGVGRRDDRIRPRRRLTCLTTP